MRTRSLWRTAAVLLGAAILGTLAVKLALHGPGGLGEDPGWTVFNVGVVWAAVMAGVVDRRRRDATS